MIRYIVESPSDTTVLADEEFEDYVLPVKPSYDETEEFIFELLNNSPFDGPNTMTLVRAAATSFLNWAGDDIGNVEVFPKPVFADEVIIVEPSAFIVPNESSYGSFSGYKFDTKSDSVIGEMYAESKAEKLRHDILDAANAPNWAY